MKEKNTKNCLFYKKNIYLCNRYQLLSREVYICRH